MATLITDPNELALAGCVIYTGDVNPINHGGMWYDSTEWVTNGYANAVRIDVIPDTNETVIDVITINKPSSEVEMMRALRCCGQEQYNGDTCTEIECCALYGFYDVEAEHTVVIDPGTTFDTEEAAEEQAWRVLNEYVGKHSCNP